MSLLLISKEPSREPPGEEATLQALRASRVCRGQQECLPVLPMMRIHLPRRVQGHQVKTPEAPQVQVVPVVPVVQAVLRVLRVLSAQEDPDSMV